VYVPTAIVYHRLGATYRPESETKVYYGSRNMLIVLLKNMPATVLRRYWLQMLAAQIYQVIYFTAQGRGRSALIGKADALKDLHYTLNKRRVIQGNRRVQDAHIEEILCPWGQYGRLDNRRAVSESKDPPLHTFIEGEM